MKQHILFLTYRMQMGFGVDVVVYNLYRQLNAMGIEVTVGCIERDDTYDDINIIELTMQANEILAKAHALCVTHVIAHTSPFFELLPQINASIPCWAYEHGDPTPSLFPPDEAREREAVKQFKQQHCYPALQGVIAISEFIKQDIADKTGSVNNTHVIYNGCDHIPDMGSKPFEIFAVRKTQKLKIGFLMRIGKGESFYKGNQMVVDLFQQLDKTSIPFEFHVMGRGSEEDALLFKKMGIITHLNASESEKINYLRDLDLFVSLSLWEGFNLPLVEAQSLGTVSIALDTGAHPEVTPYLMSSLADMISFVKACYHNHNLTYQASRNCYHFVRRSFTWQLSALSLQKILMTSHIKIPPSKIQKLKAHLKQDGILSTTIIIGRYFLRRIKR